MISAVVITLTITIKTITEGQLNRRYEFYYELNTLVSTCIYSNSLYADGFKYHNQLISWDYLFVKIRIG